MFPLWPSILRLAVGVMSLTGRARPVWGQFQVNDGLRTFFFLISIFSCDWFKSRQQAGLTTETSGSPMDG